MTVRRAKREVRSSEFVRWSVHRQIESAITTPDQYYLAAIRATIAALFAEKGKDIKLEDFVLKFVAKNADEISAAAKILSERPELQGTDIKVTSAMDILHAWSKLDYKKNPIKPEDMTPQQREKMEHSLAMWKAHTHKRDAKKKAAGKKPTVDENKVVIRGDEDSKIKPVQIPKAPSKRRR